MGWMHNGAYHMQLILKRFICHWENVWKMYYAVCSVCNRNGTRAALRNDDSGTNRGIFHEREGKTLRQVRTARELEACCK